MTELKKFTVKREEWLRGTTPSFLRNKKGKMCCLGFCALQLFNYIPQDIENVGMPHEFDTDENYAETWGSLESDDEHLYQISHTNDSYDLSDDEREEELTELFLDVGIKIEFED